MAPTNIKELIKDFKGIIIKDWSRIKPEMINFNLSGVK